MRDIRQVLERWGAWAANNHEDVTWSPIAAGFKGLIPEKVKSRPQCCDDDAMIICGCMARLNRNNSDLHDLLVDYYVLGETFMALARKHGCSDTCIGKRLHKAEGIVDADGFRLAGGGGRWHWPCDVFDRNGVAIDA